MKTTVYNPSPIELDFAQVIKGLQLQIQDRLGTTNKILEIRNHLDKDNPTLVFDLIDQDGDKHQLVMKFIQRMEE